MAPSAEDETSPSTSGVQNGRTSPDSPNDADLKDDKSNKPRKRRWFGSSKGGSDKSAPATSTSSSVGQGKDGQQTRPVNLQHSRNVSNYSGKTNRSSSLGREWSLYGSGANSDSFSIRNQLIDHAQDHVDYWGSRAAGGTERAERELGLGDDVNMVLS